MRDRDRERQRHRQREKQAPYREPDMGLEPRTPGSHPGLKAGAKPLSHPGIPIHILLNGCQVFNTEKPHSGFNHSPTVGHLDCFHFWPFKCCDEYLYAYHFSCILDDFLTVIPEVAFLGGKIFKALGIYIARLFPKRWGLKVLRSEPTFSGTHSGLHVQGGVVTGKSLSLCHFG